MMHGQTKIKFKCHRTYNQFHRTVLLEKLTGLQLVKKFPAFYQKRWFITAFTTARHLPLSWATWIQSIHPFHFLKFHFNFIIPSTPRSTSGILPTDLLIKTMYASLHLPKRATCAAYLIFLDLITRIIFGEVYRSHCWQLSSLRSPVTSSLSSSPPYSRTPSSYATRSILKTTFDIHTKQQ